MSDLEILDLVWFNRVGMIKTRNPVTQEIAVYVGIGDGVSEREDIDNILRWGTKLTDNNLFVMFRFFDTEHQIAKLEEVNKQLNNYNEELRKNYEKCIDFWKQENTKLQEQLDMFDVPKYRVGDKPFAIIDTMAYTDVRQVTIKNVYTVYEVDDGAFVTLQHSSRCFDSEDEAQKYLEERK